MFIVFHVYSHLQKFRSRCLSYNIEYLKARFRWQGKIQQFYDIDKKKIGEGSYGSVCKARNKARLEGKRECKVAKRTDE